MKGCVDDRGTVHARVCRWGTLFMQAYVGERVQFLQGCEDGGCYLCRCVDEGCTNHAVVCR